MKRGTGYVSSLAAAVGFIACSGSMGGSTSEGEPVIMSDDTQYVSHTAVRLNTDGTHDEKTTMITVAEQKAQHAAMFERRLHPAGSQRFRPLENTAEQDPRCNDYDIWLWTGTGETGSEICFYATDTYGPPYGDGPSAVANLASYTYCSTYNFILRSCTGYTAWAGHVQSFIPGDDEEGSSPGCITQASTYNGTGYQQQVSVGQAGTNTTNSSETNYVWLNQVCCPSAYSSCTSNYNSTCTNSDRNNCGGCGNVCPADANCEVGVCACSEGSDWQDCGGTCKPTVNYIAAPDPMSCGGCGKPGVQVQTTFYCTAGQPCVGTAECYHDDGYCCSGLHCTRYVSGAWYCQ